MKQFGRWLAILALGLGIHTSTWAQIPTTDIAAIIEAVVEFVETGIQWGEEAKQWEQSYEEAKRLRSLTDGLSSFRNINNTTDIANAVSRGRQSYQQMDAVFGSSGVAPKNSTTQLQAVEGVVQTTAEQRNAQRDKLVSESERINDLAAQSQNSTGTLQAQQAGNQIMVELAQQIQSQRAQQMSEADAQQALQKKQLQEKESSEAVTGLMTGVARPTAGK